MLRKFRTLFLLLILITVGLTSWRSIQRLTTWEHSLHVAIYPVAADSSAISTRYVNELNIDHFTDIGDWLQRQTVHYGNPVLQPVIVNLARPLNALPPQLPETPNAFNSILWSLQLRWWAFRHDNISGPRPHIRLFVLFHDPEQMSTLPHSIGLSQGQIGVIHAFASRQQRRQNMVVIGHELLHTFGATDKYNLHTLQPIFPEGYAEPQREPRWPQQKAEIMGGRIPLSSEQAEMPLSLEETVIGTETAKEIGLLRSTR